MLKSIEPLWQTLRSLKGNQRALVVMEPLWSVPNKLFAPFASVYMVAIGLTGQQVGTTISVALAMQLVWAWHYYPEPSRTNLADDGRCSCLES